MRPPMNNASEQEVAVFNAALQLAMEQCVVYVDQACAWDHPLREQPARRKRAADDNDDHQLVCRVARTNQQVSRSGSKPGAERNINPIKRVKID